MNDDDPRPSSAWRASAADHRPPQPSAPPPVCLRDHRRRRSPVGVRYPQPRVGCRRGTRRRRRPTRSRSVSLVFGLAQFVCFYFVGAIVAIVTATSLAARSSVRTARGRAGLALAGSILGYVGLALVGPRLAVGIVVFFVFFADDMARVRRCAPTRTTFVDRVQHEAIDVRRRVCATRRCCARAYIDYDGRQRRRSITLADGTPILDADGADWEAEPAGGSSSTATFVAVRRRRARPIPQAIDGSTPRSATRSCTQW